MYDTLLSVIPVYNCYVSMKAHFKRFDLGVPSHIFSETKGLIVCDIWKLPSPNFTYH